MVWVGPTGRITDEGRSIHEVAEEVTDEDLDWLNEYSLGLVRYERAWPVVDIRPDPRLSQQVLQ
jgi:hypothetical protein